jgi:hypothetical protein
MNLDKFSKLKFESFEQFVMACNQQKYAIVSEPAAKIILSDGRLHMIAPHLEPQVNNKLGTILGCEVFCIASTRTKKIEDWHFYVTDEPIKIQE